MNLSGAHTLSRTRKHRKGLVGTHLISVSRRHPHHGGAAVRESVCTKGDAEGRVENSFNNALITPAAE